MQAPIGQKYKNDSFSSLFFSAQKLTLFFFFFFFFFLEWKSIDFSINHNIYMYICINPSISFTLLTWISIYLESFSFWVHIHTQIFF